MHGRPVIHVSVGYLFEPFAKTSDAMVTKRLIKNLSMSISKACHAKGWDVATCVSMDDVEIHDDDIRIFEIDTIESDRAISIGIVCQIVPRMNKPPLEMKAVETAVVFSEPPGSSTEHDDLWTTTIDSLKVLSDDIYATINHAVHDGLAASPLRCCIAIGIDQVLDLHPGHDTVPEMVDDRGLCHEALSHLISSDEHEPIDDIARYLTQDITHVMVLADEQFPTKVYCTSMKERLDTCIKVMMEQIMELIGIWTQDPTMEYTWNVIFPHGVSFRRYGKRIAIGFQIRVESDVIPSAIVMKIRGGVSAIRNIVAHAVKTHVGLETSRVVGITTDLSGSLDCSDPDL
jgi:hypothetical protein